MKNSRNKLIQEVDKRIQYLNAFNHLPFKSMKQSLEMETNRIVI